MIMDSQTISSEERILSLMKNSSKGVSDKDIQKALPELSVTQIVGILNELILKGLIDLYKQPGGKIIYKIKISSEPECLREADNEEKVVYRIVEEAGNKGIWIREIRVKSNLGLTQSNKIIKSLEKKKMIKSVTTVKAGKKKVYMLYNLEPDRSLTGGAWYSDQDFESDFVDALNQQCHRFLESKREKALEMIGGPLVVNNNSYAAVSDVWTFISETGISKIQLSIEDIETILMALLYDGKVEKKLTVAGKYLYKSVEPLLSPPGYVRAPCGICPVFRNCDSSCSINPKNCTYLTEWLA